MNPRDIYIAYQAEIGTEDVILDRPWIHKAIPSKVSASQSTLPRLQQGHDFFQSISEVLKPGAVKPEQPLVGSTHGLTLPMVPEFKDLDAYWKYLTAEYPVWYPSTSIPLARAEGTSHPILAVVEIAPSVASMPKVFNGEAGHLLEKMMKAIHLDHSQLYRTSVMKSPPSGRHWARKDIAKMLPFFLQELALAGCSTVLLCGEACAQAVLRTGKSLDSLRQQPVQSDGFVFVASYHPSELETKQELKRGAWDDLKRLRPQLGGGMS